MVPDHRTIGSAHHSEVGLVVAVIVSRYRLVTGYSKTDRNERAIRAIQPVPDAGRIAPHRDIADVVTVKITRRHEIFVCDTKILKCETASALHDVPDIARWPEDHEIGLAIVVCVHGL